MEGCSEGGRDDYLGLGAEGPDAPHGGNPVTEPRSECDYCGIFRVLIQCARCGLNLCRDCDSGEIHHYDCKDDPRAHTPRARVGDPDPDPEKIRQDSLSLTRLREEL